MRLIIDHRNVILLRAEAKDSLGVEMNSQFSDHRHLATLQFMMDAEALGIQRSRNSQVEIDTLSHYTTAEGLIGILSSGSIRATHCRYLNDSMEMKHGLKITRDVISQQSKHLDNKLHKLLFKKLGNLVKYYDLNKPMGEPYVACFSKRGDQLGQWRAYGARGLGYSIL
jgi:hypothetical protein